MDVKTILYNFDAIAEAPGAILRVRDLVLQLAFSGQLTRRDSSDAPVTELLHSIVLGRGSLRVAGPNRKGTPASGPFRIPSHWTWVRLEEIARYNDRPKVSPAGLPNGAWSLDLEDIEKGTSRLLQRVHVCERPSASTRCHFRVGDVLYGKLRPYLDKALLADQDGYCTTEIVPIIPERDIEPEFLRWSLRRPDFRKYVEKLSYGVKMPRLGTRDAKASVHPLPPFGEQKRIVEKVGELLGQCDELEARQQRRRYANGRFRSSALNALTEAETPADLRAAWSRLSENWPAIVDSPDAIREIRATILGLAVGGYLTVRNASDGPVTKTIADTVSERGEMVRQRLTRLTADSAEYGRSDPLPHGWAWAPLQDLVRFIDYRGRTPAKTASGVPLITAKNIRRGFINPEPREFIAESMFDSWMTRGLPREGDVLFTTEAPMGNAAMIRTTKRFALAQRAINLAPYGDFSGAYLEVLLLSPWFEAELSRRATGMTATGIKAAKLRLIRIPVPPVEEQRRIVDRVGGLLSLCDQVESHLNRQSLAQSAVSVGLTQVG